MSDPCEDCKLPSDLGMKCRACYKLWSLRLWADIPEHQERLAVVSKMLNAMHQGDRKTLANAALGNGGSVKPDQLKAVKRVLDGPFGPQLQSCLQAITNAPDEGHGARAPRKGVE